MYWYFNNFLVLALIAKDEEGVACFLKVPPPPPPAMNTPLSLSTAPVNASHLRRYQHWIRARLCIFSMQLFIHTCFLYKVKKGGWMKKSGVPEIATRGAGEDQGQFDLHGDMLSQFQTKSKPRIYWGTEPVCHVQRAILICKNSSNNLK